MRTQTAGDRGIQSAWRLACALERINSKQPDRLPRLLSLDGALNIPNGVRYALVVRRDQETIAPVIAAAVQAAVAAAGRVMQMARVRVVAEENAAAGGIENAPFGAGRLKGSDWRG